MEPALLIFLWNTQAQYMVLWIFLIFISIADNYNINKSIKFFLRGLFVLTTLWIDFTVINSI